VTAFKNYAIAQSVSERRPSVLGRAAAHWHGGGGCFPTCRFRQRL